MFDELDRLRDSEALFTLLDYYAELVNDDREQWHDRLQEWDRNTGRKLADIYGELIAHGWLEQNTGVTPILEPDRFAACYRITSAGLKALKIARKHHEQLTTVESE